MIIKIGNYMDEFKVEEVADSAFLIDVEVITGDEVVAVYYRDSDGTIKKEVFDWGGREMDFVDFGYCIDPTNDEEMLHWQNRTSTYEPLYESLELYEALESEES